MANPILARNLDWVTRRIREEPQYFRSPADLSAEWLLWIGCSDNPLASLEVAPFDRGVLVHRNPGNQVSHHDQSLHATLQVALQVCKVGDIVVCGHYSCRCLQDALSPVHSPGLQSWVTPIRELARQNRGRLDEIVAVDAQIQSLCEINVRAQLSNLAAHAAIGSLLAAGKVRLHGVVWSSRDGLLREIEPMPLDDRHRGATGSTRAAKRPAARRRSGR